MKPKYVSVMMILFSLTAVGLGAWYELHRHQADNSQSGRRYPQPLSEIKVPGKPVLEQMDRIERRMHLLSTPPPRMVHHTDLSVLGYILVSPAEPNGRMGDAPSTLGSEHRVTMAFEGQVNRFCIIDSKLYPEGAVLPDGATIVKIESRRVLIANKSLQQWLSVDPLIGAALSEESS